MSRASGHVGEHDFCPCKAVRDCKVDEQRPSLESRLAARRPLAPLSAAPGARDRARKTVQKAKAKRVGGKQEPDRHRMMRLVRQLVQQVHTDAESVMRARLLRCADGVVLSGRAGIRQVGLGKRGWRIGVAGYLDHIRGRRCMHRAEWCTLVSALLSMSKFAACRAAVPDGLLVYWYRAGTASRAISVSRECAASRV